MDFPANHVWLPEGTTITIYDAHLGWFLLGPRKNKKTRLSIISHRLSRHSILNTHTGYILRRHRPGLLQTGGTLGSFGQFQVRASQCTCGSRDDRPLPSGSSTACYWTWASKQWVFLSNMVIFKSHDSLGLRVIIVGILWMSWPMLASIYGNTPMSHMYVYIYIGICGLRMS